jgi:hypothetical protein
MLALYRCGKWQLDSKAVCCSIRAAPRKLLDIGEV